MEAGRKLKSELCGVLYADGVTCTLEKGHPHKQWHRNGFRVWMKPKSEYAYMQGNPDHEWRELAEAFIRDQIAPGDVERVKYWMKRLDQRARKQALEDS